MKRAGALLVLALMLPAASGAASDAVADLVVTMDLPLGDFVEVGAPADPAGAFSDPTATAPAATHMCKDAQQYGQPGAPLTFLSSHRPAGYETLVFAEGQQEIGCAEARFEIPLPDIPQAAKQAATFRLDFVAGRNVASSAGNLDTYVEQGVRFYTAVNESIDDPALPVLQCFGKLRTFPNTLDLVTPGARISLNFELPRCGSSLEGKRLILAFYFLDANPATPVPGVAMPVGQQFEAQIAGATVTFIGTQIPLDLEFKRGSDPQATLVGFLEARIHVPGPRPGQVHEVSFGINNEWGIHALYKQGLDGLDIVQARALRAEESDGRLLFTLSKELLRDSGPGDYVVVFTGSATGQVESNRIPLVVIALTVPLLAGLLAQRNLNDFYRSSRGRLRGARWGLQLVLVGAWSLYIGIAVALVISSTGLGMAAWPLPRANVIAYLLLALTIAVMVVVGVVARRRNMELVLEDLNELERIQVELERSNRELEQFAYVASHDLKEPLRMVAGYTQLLEMRYGKKLDDQGKDYLLFAADGSRRLQHMVDDLLAYSRVRSDQATYKEVDLNRVMIIVEGHLRGLLSERSVRLSYGDLPTLHGDQGQLVQLLLNLVQNAIKFSPQAEPVVEVMATRDGDRYHLSVRDEGIGIDDAQQERIFHIFQRLHLREEYEGNGIGLAMCKKISEQMGGRISVTSTPGKGSTFTVVLPDLLARAPRAARAAELTRAPRSADSPA